MEGVVLGYQAEEGVIRATDGSRYTFSRADWKSERDPVAGHRVDFLPQDGRATEVYLTDPATGAFYSTVSSIEKSEKTMATVVYICYVASFLYGITMLVGVVIAYVSRGSAEGKWYQSHYNYQISIFWKSLIGFLLGALTIFFGVGIVIIICTYIWVIVKIVKGWRALSEGREISK
jgi:uncharacterized membrane protein